MRFINCWGTVVFISNHLYGLQGKNKIFSKLQIRGQECPVNATEELSDQWFELTERQQ